MSRSARVAEELRSSSLKGVRVFERGKFALLPEPARLYLEHAIAPGTPLASAVGLRMRGEIKRRRWLPLTAEQVIHRGTRIYLARLGVDERAADSWLRSTRGWRRRDAVEAAWPHLCDDRLRPGFYPFGCGPFCDGIGVAAFDAVG
jgi:hypothetical protein